MEQTEAVARARKLIPALKERARHAEQLRHMPDETIADLRQAGLFSLMAPRHHGGEEQPLAALTSAVVEVGKACGSSAWILCIYGIHNWIAGLYDRPLQQELFEGRDHVLFPGAFGLMGKARPVDGGYRLTGRWPFGTGVHHSDWVAVSAGIEGDEGSDRFSMNAQLFMLPRAAVEVVDTWHVSGLCGTGSHDVAVHDVFIPAHRGVGFMSIAMGTAPGARLSDSGLYTMPLFACLAAAATAPAVGMALGAIELFTERAKGRKLRFSRCLQSEQPQAQVRLSQSAAEARAAQLLLDAAVSQLDESARARQPLSIPDRIALRRDCVHAVALCKSAVLRLAEASGASAIHLDHPMQRFARDVSALSTHVVFDQDAAHELYGATAMGYKPTNFMF